MLVDRRLALLPALDVDVGVIGDEPRRAGRSLSSPRRRRRCRGRIGCSRDWGRCGYRRRSGRRARIAGNRCSRRPASPAACSAAALLDRAARLAAIVAIGDVERVFVGQRRLDARPRAHVEADLLAHPAGERIGREGENADPAHRRRAAPARSRDPCTSVGASAK